MSQTQPQGIDAITAAYAKATAAEQEAAAWRATAGTLARQAMAEGRIGRAREITATDLAVRLGIDRSMMTKVLAGQAWK